MDENEQLERIISLLENLLLRSSLPQSKDYDYWRCRCGFENIQLETTPKVCIICQEMQPLGIEAARAH